MKLSRRNLLAGAAAMVGRVSLTHPAFAWPVHGVATSFALVAPSGSWSGVAGSGGSAPSDPARTTAKPALQWWQPSQIRGVGPTLASVIADAKGGISKVTFWVEGTSQDVTTQTYVADTDVNGVARIRPMWGINVDCPAAVAAHAAGVVRVYATAYPNDASMQARTIGPLTIYPRAVQYDWDKTVNSAGGADYTSLATAMQAMKTALTPVGSGGGGKECGRVTITGSGTYDWGYPDAYGFPWSFGYSCVTVANGVTATIARFNNSGVNAFDPYRGGPSGNSSDGGLANQINDPWTMWSYVNNLEFRGSGLMIDRKNIGWFGSAIASGGANYVAGNCVEAIHGAAQNNGSFFFNGCQVTNSYGAWPQLYWNQAIPTALIAWDPNTGSAVCRGDGVTLNWLSGGQVFLSGDNNSGAIFTKTQNALGTMHQGAHMTYGEYTANCPLSNENLYTPHDGSGRLQGVASCTIQYVGSQTGATLNFNGSNQLVFSVTGASPYTVTFQPIDPTRYAAHMTASPPQPVTWSDIQTYMTANHPGDWTFSIPAGAMSPFWIPNVDATYQTWPQNVKASAYTVLSTAAFHTEGAMWNGPYENVIYQANTWTKCGFSTISLNVHDSGDKDFSFKNNTFDSGGQSNSNGGNTIAPLGSHILFENNTLFDHFGFQTGGLDSYSTCAQNVFGYLDSTGGYTGGGIPANCVAAGTLPSGTGCVQITGTGGGGWMNYTTQWTALFNSPSTGDWTPKVGSTLANNLFAIINPRDAQGAARAGSDAAGSWKLGGSAPNWPF